MFLLIAVVVPGRQIMDWTIKKDAPDMSLFTYVMLIAYTQLSTKNQLANSLVNVVGLLCVSFFVFFVYFWPPLKSAHYGLRYRGGSIYKNVPFTGQMGCGSIRRHRWLQKRAEEDRHECPDSQPEPGLASLCYPDT